MRDLYIEAYGGISGDMIVAALLDLGADQAIVRKALDALQMEGFEIVISRTLKSGLDVCDFDVILDADHENHDHDMAYLYGEEHVTHEHHDHGEHSREAHGHSEHGDHHAHHGRNLADITAIINRGYDAGGMTESARDLALKIFGVLAEAESKAHGKPISEIHFHEVGAVDSIVDIVAAAVCFDNLDVGRVFVPRLREGSGTVRCQHGVLPVPVPAVVNIVTKHALPLEITGWKGEYVTPTGAAFAAAVVTDRKLPERFVVKQVGMGAGKRQCEGPGLLRILEIEPAEPDERQSDK